MVYIRNMLARHEIHVANYYFKRGAYMAALKRGQNVVENMQETTAVADGLAVMAQAYILLEMSELAKDSVRVLCANYPEHPKPSISVLRSSHTIRITLGLASAKVVSIARKMANEIVRKVIRFIGQ